MQKTDQRPQWKGNFLELNEAETSGFRCVVLLCYVLHFVIARAMDTTNVNFIRFDIRFLVIEKLKLSIVIFRIAAKLWPFQSKSDATS